MVSGSKHHLHIPTCYDEKEYDDYSQGIHIRKCMMYCPICKKELRPEFYYSVIKGPPIKEKSKNKVLELNKRKYSNHK